MKYDRLIPDMLHYMGDILNMKLSQQAKPLHINNINDIRINGL